ncbi:5-oxoprolinase subunit C family protein [Psychroserpens sp. BH13MA-6]
MVEVLKTGLLDTVQDLGRLGYAEYGVPISGVMDRYSAAVANGILGNSLNAAVIEIIATGPKLQFEIDTQLCISGANISPKINDLPIANNQCVFITKGEILSFGKLLYGCRAYIAIAGGFLTPSVLGSRSMYQTITKSSQLSKGAKIKIAEAQKKQPPNYATVAVNDLHFNSEILEVYKGPEFELLNQIQQEWLFRTTFTLSNKSNRMAYQIEETLSNDLQDIITSLVLPGTIQLTPSGQMIILMRDCQTTGGYPRILQLEEASINRLSQKIFGSKIRLKRKN